jgi:hypothetical protein
MAADAGTQARRVAGEGHLDFDQGWSWPAALGARTIASSQSNLVAFAFPS